MIALAGTIGTGLFLSSGKAIARGGPLGAFMGYTFTGILVSGVVISIAELRYAHWFRSASTDQGLISNPNSALVPLSGGIIRTAEYFVDPALSFANGWNSIYSSMVSLPAEIVAAAVIVQFWDQVTNSAVYITVFGVLLLASNLCLVRIYGELEFTFAMLKIMLIIGLNIMALVVTCKHLLAHAWSQLTFSRRRFVSSLFVETVIGTVLICLKEAQIMKLTASDIGAIQGLL